MVKNLLRRRHSVHTVWCGLETFTCNHPRSPCRMLCFLLPSRGVGTHVSKNEVYFCGAHTRTFRGNERWAIVSSRLITVGRRRRKSKCAERIRWSHVPVYNLGLYTYGRELSARSENRESRRRAAYHSTFCVSESTTFAPYIHIIYTNVNQTAIVPLFCLGSVNIQCSVEVSKFIRGI